MGWPLSSGLVYACRRCVALPTIDISQVLEMLAQIDQICGNMRLPWPFARTKILTICQVSKQPPWVNWWWYCGGNSQNCRFLPSRTFTINCIVGTRLVSTYLYSSKGFLPVPTIYENSSVHTCSLFWVMMFPQSVYWWSSWLLIRALHPGKWSTLWIKCVLEGVRTPGV